jgi:hypothetical protein
VEKLSFGIRCGSGPKDFCNSCNRCDFCHNCRKWVEAVHDAAYDGDDDCAEHVLTCPECNKVLFEAEVRREREKERKRKKLGDSKE